MNASDAHVAAMACPYDGLARTVFFVLLTHSRDGLAWPSQGRIAAITGFKERAVGRALKRLEGEGAPNLGALIRREGFASRGVVRWRLLVVTSTAAAQDDGDRRPACAPSHRSTGRVQ